MLERVEREDPDLSLRVVASSGERLAVDGGAALGEERAEADRDELCRLAEVELRAVVDVGDGPVREDVRGKGDGLHAEGGRDPRLPAP